MSEGETLVLDPAQVDLFLGTEHGPLDKAAMLRDEVRRVREFFSNSNPSYPLPHSSERWVEEVFRKHEALIKLWCGWRYHGDWVNTTEIDTDVLLEVFDHMKSTVYSCLQERAIPRLLDEIEGGVFVPERLSSLQNMSEDELRRWNDERDIRREMNLLEPGISYRTLRSKHWEPPTPSDPDEVHEVPVFYSSATEARAKLKRGAAISRAVLRTVRRYIKKHPMLSDDEKSTIVAAWERMFEEIGHLWSGTTRQYSVSFTCAPSSFLRLGHFGESSCYASGGGYELSKYVLAETKNTLVSLIYRRDDTDGPCKEGEPNGREWWQPRRAKVKGRAWGVGIPEYGLSLSNFYLIDREVHGNIAAQTAVRALKVKRPLDLMISSSEVNSMGQDELLYLNNDARDYSIEGSHYDYHRKKLQEVGRDCQNVCHHYYDHREAFNDDDYYEGDEEPDDAPF